MTQLAQDQAEGLRRLFTADMRRMVGMMQAGRDGTVQALAYGVAAALAGQGNKVLLLDEMLAAGDRHPAGSAPIAHDLSTLLMRARDMQAAIVNTGHGVALLAGGGTAHLVPRPRMEAHIGLVNDFYRLAGRYDIVLVAAAQQPQWRPSFVWACQDVILLSDGAAASLTALYGHIKTLQQSGARRFHLLFEEMETAQAAALYRNVAAVSRRHLQLMPEHLGIVPADAMQSAAFCRRLAVQLQTWPVPEQRNGHFPALMRRLLAGPRAAPALDR